MHHATSPAARTGGKSQIRGRAHRIARCIAASTLALWPVALWSGTPVAATAPTRVAVADQAPAEFSLYDGLRDGQWRVASGATWLAQSFTVGKTPTRLTRASVWFRNSDETKTWTTATHYSMYLYTSNEHGRPGYQLAQITGSTKAALWANSQRSFTTNVDLQPDTTYFIVMRGSNPGFFGWKYSTGTPPAHTSKDTPLRAYRTTDNGGSWSALTDTYFSLQLAGRPLSTPSAPTGVVVSAGDGILRAGWVAPSFNGGLPILRYTASTSPDGRTCTVTVSTCTIDGLRNNLDYTVTVIAENVLGAGERSAASASVTTRAQLTPTPLPTITASPSASVEPLDPPSATAQATPGFDSTITATPVPTLSSTTLSESPSTSNTTTTAIPTEQGGIGSADTNAVNSDASSAGSAVSLFGNDQPTSVLDLTTELEVGAPAAGKLLTVQGVGLQSGATVRITLHSDPVVLADAIADAAGGVNAEAAIPDGLTPGAHTIVITSTSPDGAPVQTVFAFLVDDAGVVSAIAPASQEPGIEPGSPELARALRYEMPVYAPTNHPATTAAVATAASAAVGLASGAMSAGGSSPRMPTPSGGGQEGGGGPTKLFSAAVSPVEAARRARRRAGDASRSWHVPGTAAADRWLIRLVEWFQPRSMLTGRLLLDGAWARAMLGSAGLVTWFLGATLGFLQMRASDFTVMPASHTLIALTVALSLLDAGAGLFAWLVIAAGAAVTGNIQDLSDLRTLLGLAVVSYSLPLLGHCLRPMRRAEVSGFLGKFDRVADYLVPPVLLTFLGSMMYKALNGLSGLALVDGAEADQMRWVIALGFFARMACEDVATHLYPERLAAVQPAGFTAPGVRTKVITIVGRSIATFIVAMPFFGVGWEACVVVVLQNFPSVLALMIHRLPNSVFINRWNPRGLAGFLGLVVVLTYSATWLMTGGLGPVNAVTFLLLMLPFTFAALLEMFGREGAQWDNIWPKRIGGIVVWVLAVGLTWGFITPPGL